MYGHFLPSEYTGYADALSRPPNAPYAHPGPLGPADALDDDAASPTRGTIFRLPVVGDDPKIPDHAQQPAPVLVKDSGWVSHPVYAESTARPGLMKCGMNPRPTLENGAIDHP